MNTEDNGGMVERFDLNQRIQHILLALLLIILVVTGLSLMFHNTWWGRLIIQLEGGIATRGIIHRISAILLLLLGVYHFYYVVFTEKGHNELMKLKFGWKDIKKFGQIIAYNLGVRKQYPEFGKYDSREKIQYWLVVLGIILISATGFVLWFESLSMRLFPKWFIDLTLIIHGWEGVIIFLILLFWHLYNTHLNPLVFPMDYSWLTGRVSMEWLKQTHSKEYKKHLEDEN